MVPESPRAPSIIFQAGKLGDRDSIVAELEWAARLLREGAAAGRVYGLSGGALSAAAFALALAARRDPRRWGRAADAPVEFAAFLRRARGRDLHALNFNPWHGVYNLRPLRRWLAARLQHYAGRADVRLSDIGLPLYLCAGDEDATLTLLGPRDDTLQFQYYSVHVGPPRDTPIVDALIAALSTPLSTEPARVPEAGGAWLRDCRPAIADAGALVADLEAADPRPIVRRRPHTHVRTWPQNFVSSAFVLHSQNERNQTLLAAYYLDLLERHAALEAACRALPVAAGEAAPPVHAPRVVHVDLHYVGSSEAFTNMRQSVENKDALMARFRRDLQGQLDGCDFDRDLNVQYGAGGFSGILAGLVTTRAVDAGLARGSGRVRWVYGVSAGVLNGLFHAVQLAAARLPGVYTPAARRALDDLEDFVAHLAPERVGRFNRNPLRAWHGWANLEPLRAFLLERLAAYTGTAHPEAITFDDIGLPLTVAVGRRDGFTDFLGMTSPERHMRFAGREWRVLNAPVVQAVIAGWSMPVYVLPVRMGEQEYSDGGGTFYDPGLFVACLDGAITNLLNIHLDEPEGNTYGIPPRPHLLRMLFDLHNYQFPEERHRMRLLVDLLYAHYELRELYADALQHSPGGAAGIAPLPADFRQSWDVVEGARLAS